MNRSLKKVVAIVLTMLMAASFILPAAAAGVPTLESCKDPVIYIAGDSGDIFYDNDEKTFRIDDIFSSSGDEDDDNSKIWEAVANITLPFVLEGIAFDKWDNYYAAVEKEIGELFEAIRLDGNGNVPEGSDSGIGKVAEQDNAISMTTNRTLANGRYGERSYYFHYDWRLDPIEVAEQLNEFINGVCTSTGRTRVSITCKCLGTNVVLAYINKYGSDKIKGLGIDVATSKGSEFISGALSGDFGIDGHALARFLKDVEFYYGFSVSPVITSTIELLANTGVLDKMTDVAREELYAKIEYGIISALATSTFLTFPSYWALVSTEDFDDALYYVFGEKNSKKYKEYEGLIKKVTYYNDTVKANIDDILASTKEVAKDGKSVNLCIVSKYGTQLVPIVEDGSVLGDTFVSVNRSSFGATTSTVYDTLSDEYIQGRIDEGKGKYISPDKKIDASTCLFPEYTWFVKGCKHSTYTPAEIRLILTVIDAQEQLTVDDFDWTQFIIYTPSEDDSKGEWGTFSKMTKDNCNIEQWEADSELEKPQTKQQRIFTLVVSLLKWLTTILALVTQLLGSAN